MKLVYQYNRRKEVHGVLVRNPKCMTRLRGGLAIASMLTLLAAATSGILSPVGLTNLCHQATPNERDDGAGIAVRFSGAYGAPFNFSRLARNLHHGRAGSTDCRLPPVFHEPRRVRRRRCLTSSTSGFVGYLLYFLPISQISSLRLDAGSRKCTCALLCTSGWVHRRRASAALGGLSCPTTSHL
ncbi:hypothetical protein ALC56_02925 [Trachymyrmex septentrionalis]|uniref:Uncharacterized protein n=1 Tax=Trachymyrmex septentrionalis TaxID=34720 RepID=A0A195FPS2_9HYME|nr:hypothetical protein ALC56_02925 [Trachymyrmex septentrionalis]